ncbi:MAG: hypothetical protein JXA14_03945 [Anaerolineae bacterium]|nr:hypothetical protein [Anaerolineae bacterium]
MHSKVLIVVIALSVAVQACCCCTNLLGGPQPPYTITHSEETIQRLQERVNAIETDANDNFSLTISEEEMTALAVQALDEMEEGPPISELQVFFRNARVELYMIIHLSDSFSLPGMIAFTIDAREGDFAVTIEEMIVGPLPLPESVTEAMTEALNDALTEGVSNDEGNVLITDVQIGDKEMTIYGQMSR